MSDKNQNIPDKLPIPWHWDEVDLTIQLLREMPLGHILASKKLKSIARRQDNDDVLFEIDSDDFKYAVVHLTWAQKRLNDSTYPSASLYKDWGSLYSERILKDKEFFDEQGKE